MSPQPRNRFTTAQLIKHTPPRHYSAACPCDTPPPMPPPESVPDDSCLKMPCPRTEHGNGSQISGEKQQWLKWGDRDNHPFALIEKVNSDRDAPQSLAVAKGYILGQSPPRLFKHLIDGTKSIVSIPEIDEYMHDNEFAIQDAIDTIVDNYAVTNNAFVSIYVRNGIVADFRAVDVCYVRGLLRIDADTGKKSHIGYTQFAQLQVNGSPNYNAIVRSYSLLPDNDKDLRALPDGDYMLHIRDNQTANPFYSVEKWSGGKTWLDIRRKSEDTLNAILDNRFTPSYNITINPRKYNELETEEEKKAAFKEDFELLSGMLTGSDQAGRTLVSVGDLNNMGDTVMPMYTIEPVEDPTNYTELIKAINETGHSTAIFFGLVPSLLGMKQEGGLSSGSEMLNSDNIQLTRHVRQIRRKILSFLQIIFIINGLKEKYKSQYAEIGFIDAALRPQAVVKSGSSPEII